MAIEKKKKPPAGAPEWLVTYGDMVTLLLTFFVLLVSMMEVKSDTRITEFMEIIREAFGYVGGMNQLPTDEVEIPKNVPLMEMLQIPVNPENFSQSKTEGLRGKRPDVTAVRPPKYFAVGAPIEFNELSDEIGDSQRVRLGEFADMLRGHSQQLEIRGHCSRRPVAGSPFEDHFALSFARAKAVAQTLVRAGIDPERIVIVAAGTNEPINARAYDPADRQQNDLVEILQVNRLVDEFSP